MSRGQPTLFSGDRGSAAAGGAATAASGGGGGAGGRDGVATPAEALGLPPISRIEDFRSYVIAIADSVHADIGAAIRVCITQLVEKVRSNPPFAQLEKEYLLAFAFALLAFQTLSSKERQAFRGLPPELMPYFPTELQEGYSRTLFIALLEVAKLSLTVLSVNEEGNVSFSWGGRFGRIWRTATSGQVFPELAKALEALNGGTKDYSWFVIGPLTTLLSEFLIHRTQPQFLPWPWLATTVGGLNQQRPIRFDELRVIMNNRLEFYRKLNDLVELIAKRELTAADKVAATATIAKLKLLLNLYSGKYVIRATPVPGASAASVATAGTGAGGAAAAEVGGATERREEGEGEGEGEVWESLVISF